MNSFQALFAGFLFLTTFSAPPALAATAAREGVYAVSALGRTADLKDLAPLDRIAKESLIVGVGENAHGTLNDVARLSLLRFFVEKHGYRKIFAEHSLVTTFSEGYQRFLGTGCKGDFNAFMKVQSSPVFQTIEWRDIFAWICDFNRANPSDPVRFIGVDIMQDPWLNHDWLDEVVERAPEWSRAAELIRDLRESCFGAKYASRKEFYGSDEYAEYEKTGTLPKQKHRLCLNTAIDLEIEFEKKDGKLRGLFPPLEYGIVTTRPGTIFSQETDFTGYPSDITGSQTIRDRQIFENLIAMQIALHAKKEPVIFLAHNYHIAKNQSALDYPDWPRVKSAGEWLRAKFGARYRTVGMTAYYTKAYYWPKDYSVISDGESSIDRALNEREADAYLIDIQGDFARSRSDWTMVGKKVPARLSTQFDYLLYMRKASEAHPIQFVRGLAPRRRIAPPRY